jgi:ketosteroid isomerase-like protein
MLKFLSAAILVALTGSAWAGADTKVLDHHVANMKTGDLNAVLSDYSPDVVIVTPPGAFSPDGIFVGSEIRKLFTKLTAKDSLPGNQTMQTKYQSAGADTSIMQWVQFKGTPKEISGYDVFVVRGGKVVFQTVTINAKK